MAKYEMTVEASFFSHFMLVEHPFPTEEKK